MVDSRTDLPRAERAAFLLDPSPLGEAVAGACAAADPAFRRLSYPVLGNAWHHPHGHVPWLYGDRLRDPSTRP